MAVAPRDRPGGHRQQRAEPREGGVAPLRPSEEVVHLIEDQNGRFLRQFPRTLDPAGERGRKVRIVITESRPRRQVEQVRHERFGKTWLARAALQAHGKSSRAQARDQARIEQRALACARRRVQAQ